MNLKENKRDYKARNKKNTMISLSIRAIQKNSKLISMQIIKLIKINQT